MSKNLSTARDEGQLSGAESTDGWQLARLTGVDGLRHLSDDEAERLIEFMNNLAGEAANEAFRAGWDARQVYNCDQRLLCAEGPPTNH